VSYADGKIYFINCISDQWNVQSENAHTFGVTSISWLQSNNENNSAFLTSGNDCLIKYWEISRLQNKEQIQEKEILEKVHSTNITCMEVYSAEDSSVLKQDHLVSVDSIDEINFWKINSDENNKNLFSIKRIENVRFANDQKPNGITHVTWSKCGIYLSISTIDSIYLYKNENDEWVMYSSMNNEGVMQNYYEEENN